MNNLTTREIYIFFKFVELSMSDICQPSYRELGEHLDLSHEYVRQIINRLIKKGLLTSTSKSRGIKFTDLGRETYNNITTSHKWRPEPPLPPPPHNCSFDIKLPDLGYELYSTLTDANQGTMINADDHSITIGFKKK